jgi:hypothetical protein
MFFDRIRRFFCRFLVYFIILLWTVSKLTNLEKHSTEFKHKILGNLSYYGLQNNDLSEILDDPIILTIYCGLEIIAGIFGLFGSYYGHITSAFLFLITNFIYFNPLHPNVKFSLYETRQEIFLNIGTLLSLLLIAFYPYDSNVNKIFDELPDLDFNKSSNKNHAKKKKN